MVGGGAAGLAAAGELAGKRAIVLLVEARPRLGGRIRTVRPGRWPLPVELGAEFVHGADPDLLEIARREALLLDRLPPEHLERHGGQWRPVRGLWRRFERATRAMRGRGPDRSVAEFLDSGRVTARDRRRLRGVFEGFEAAPVDRLSERSLSTTGEEPEGEAERMQFRFVSGYDGVVRALAREAAERGARIRCGTAVRAIAWRPGRVEVRTSRGVFRARRAILTVPIGVLQAAPGSPGAIAFDPEPASLRRALSRLAMGHVARVTLRFREPFWRDRLGDRAGATFFHTGDEALPTWWTAAPAETAMLTGWAGGPRAHRWIGAPRAALEEAALRALGPLFRVRHARLRQLLLASHSHDWSADPLTRGAYSYALVGGAGAGALLARPIERTLFFAGEATEREEGGTVPAAIRSGRRAAKKAMG